MSSGAPSLGFWLKWMLTFFAFPIGGGFAYLLVGSMAGAVKPAIGGFVTGLVLGTAQWLVFRQVIALSGWWIVATGIGLATGLALSVAVSGASIELRPLIVRAVLTGGLLGIAQWLLLRRHVTAAGLWIVVVAIGWALGLGSHPRSQRRPLERVACVRGLRSSRLCGAHWSGAPLAAAAPSSDLTPRPALCATLPHGRCHVRFRNR